MKRLLLLFFLIISCNQPNGVSVDPETYLLPYPNQIFIQKNTINLSKGLKVSNGIYSSYLKDQLLLNNVPYDKGVKVIFEKSNLDTLGEEGYQLIAKNNKISILSNTKAGTFYGIQTLLQLTKLGVVQELEIIDKPQFKWRAYMLDEGRYFQGKEVVKYILNEMAHLKMNVFHWHLTDDAGWRIEIKKYPLLTQIGSKRDSTQINYQGKKWGSEVFDGVPHRGFYTQDDIKEIVAYAKNLNIKIVPEIAMPGHASAAIASYPFLGSSKQPIRVPEKFGVGKDIFNPASPKTITFIHDVLKEVSDLFPGDIIHTGGDEVKYDQWKTNEDVKHLMKKNQLENYGDLQVHFTNNISNYINSVMGKRMMGWNEIMGNNLHNWGNNDDIATTKLSKNAIIHFWKGGFENLKIAIDAGHDLVNSDHNYTYLDYTYEQIDLKKAYSFNPIPEGLTKEEAEQILGLGTQMWGEWTPTKKEVYSQTFPRIAAYAETGWTLTNNKNYKRFKSSLTVLFKKWEENLD
ncbi:MAG: beta-N-acetylhexosaminidase [Flavobacteriaceae bacterium]|nr:beta-N-acetylhexosaminidase [Candidatus Actinomarina sp.]MDG1246883.1 beta-N-acetylhexosaminidase [Flavobacteriaceae bacterium]